MELCQSVEQMNTERCCVIADTHSDVVGQVYGLYLAGVESTGVIITCMLYELAKNQDIQHSLHLEITEVLSAFDNQVTYDSVQQMKYLQQIVSGK